MRAAILWLIFIVALMCTPASRAQQIFSDEGAFQSALGDEVAVVNLDAAALGALATPFSIQSPDAAAALQALGLDFFGLNSQVIGGQAFQIVKPDRDRLILNGSGSGGEITFNLLQPVQGVGAWTNVADGGNVQAFSEPDLGGVMLGAAPFGMISDFGGLITDQPIQSVRITCEFDFDLRCGVYDIQFGPLSLDSDGDGVADAVDNCVLAENADQTDSNGDGYGNACDADLNDDCVVNFLDLGILRTVFFTDNEDADFNGDGIVNFLDLGRFRVQFFAAPGPSGVSQECDGQIAN